MRARPNTAPLRCGLSQVSHLNDTPSHQGIGVGRVLGQPAAEADVAPGEVFARELRAWRERRGLSRKALAERMAYSPSYVAHVEAADMAPSNAFTEAAEAALDAGGALWAVWHRLDDERHEQRRERAERRAAAELAMPAGWDALVERLAEDVAERVAARLDVGRAAG